MNQNNNSNCMKDKKILLLALLLAAMGCQYHRPGQHAAGEERPAQDSLPTVIMRIQQCSRLYTTEVRIHKIVTHEDDVRLRGNLGNRSIDIPLPLGERKVAIPMDATLKAYIDLSEISAKNVERDGRRITLVLPDPKVVMTSSRIDQKGVKEFVALTRSHFTDRELSDYERQGRQAILSSIDAADITERARADAARVLVPIIAQLGYSEEDITIAFRKDMTIERLIDLDIERR